MQSISRSISALLFQGHLSSTMPSPSQGKRISSTSVGRQSAAALRRGEVKISDPIPLPRDNIDDGLPPDQDISNQRCLTDGTWPRRSTPPEADARPGSDSGRKGPSQLAVNRESAGRSANLSTMSSKNSLKQRKSGGFRATIRSLFGSKRHRSSLSNDRSYHISVRGQTLLSFLLYWHNIRQTLRLETLLASIILRSEFLFKSSTMLGRLIIWTSLHFEINLVAFISGLILCTAGSWQFSRNTREAD